MLRDLTRYVGLIVVHCSDSDDRDTLFRRSGAGLVTHTPAQEIDDWHAKRGFHRGEKARQRLNPELSAIGYHLVIYRNGAIVTGRAFAEAGAHVRGYNNHSLGICLVGRRRFATDQWRSLANVVADLGREFKRRVVPLDAAAPHDEEEGSVLRICGHHQLNTEKTCPNFDVPSWFNAGMTPDPANVWTEA